MPSKSQEQFNLCKIVFKQDFPQNLPHNMIFVSLISGKKYCYGSTQGEYCHCDYCKCKHGYGSSGYGHCH